MDKFLDELGLLADGKTQVPMKKHIYNAATDVISKVCVFVCVCVHRCRKGAFWGGGTDNYIHR